MNNSLNSTIPTKKIFQYLVEVVESLNCSLDELVNIGIFQNDDQIKRFVDYEEEGENFCILKRTDLDKDFLFFIPVSSNQIFIFFWQILLISFIKDYKMYL